MNPSDPNPAPERQQHEERTASLSIQSYEGPLPPPEYLRQYEESVPGAGQKIVDMMVSQGRHRAEVENHFFNQDVTIATVILNGHQETGNDGCVGPHLR